MNRITSLNIGIVGLGNIGRHHAEQLAALGVSVSGLDVVPAAREQFAADFGAKTYEVSGDLYEAVDAVVVTTPNRFHEEYAVEALEAGLDVLVEKPLAHTVESAERIAAAARNGENFCTVGFHNRYLPSVEVLRGYRDEGRFGDVTHVEADYVRRRGIPGRGSWFTSKGVAGGGAVIDIGVHAVDLALHLLGHPVVEEVSAVTRTEFGDRDDYTYLQMWGEDGVGDFDVEDSATALLRCADGKTASLEIAWAANREPSDEFHVRGTEAGAAFSLGSGELDIFESPSTGAPHFADSSVQTRERNAHRAEQRAFLEAVVDREPPALNTVEEALEVQRVIEAIYRSAESGRAVSLREAPAEPTPARADNASTT